MSTYMSVRLSVVYVRLLTSMLGDVYVCEIDFGPTIVYGLKSAIGRLRFGHSLL